MTQSTQNRTRPVPQARHERLVLATLCAGMFMAMLDNVVVSNALPRIGHGLGTGLTGLQWAVEGYSLVFAALLLPGGTLGDRYGRRRFYLGGLAVFTAGSAISALAPSLAILIAGRAVQGSGAAALIPQSLAILRITYPDPARQARAFGIWSSVSALGLALGPAIGGPLVEAFGWPSAFWINVPIGLGALTIGRQAIPDTPGRRAPTDPIGQVTAAVGLAALVYALIEGSALGWETTPVLACLVLSLVAFAVFLISQSRTAEPAFDHTLLRDRVVAGAVFAGFTVTFGMFGVITFLGLFMQDVLGWSPTGAGIASLPSTALIIAMSPIAARFTLRRGPRDPLTVGLLGCAAALLLLSCFGAGASYLDYCWALPLMGIGMGLCYTPVTIVVMTRVPIDRAGNASAATNVSREVGGVAGIAVMGTLITTRLRASLDAKLATQGVPRQSIHQILATTTNGGPGGFASTTSISAPIREAVAHSFVDGLHLALWVATAFLLGSAALIRRLTRP